MTPPTLSVTCDAKALASAAAWAARRISSRPELPILAGMLLEVDDAGQLTVTGFDRTVANLSTVPTERAGAGRVVVSGRLMAEIAKTLPKNTVTVEELAGSLSLVCGTIRCTLPTLPAEDYPLLPEAPKPLGTVDAQAFVDEAERVIVAADLGGTGTKACLGGVHLTFGEASIGFIATDNYRVAVSATDWKPADAIPESLVALVPGQVIFDLTRAEQAGDLTIGLSPYVVSFRGGERSIVATLLDAKDFPAKLAGPRLPTRADQPTTVAVADVADALKRAGLVLAEKDPVALVFAQADGETPASLTVRAGAGTQAMEAVLTCRHDGPPGQLWVNPEKLADALGSCHTALAELTLNPDLRKPVLVTAPGNDQFRHVLMPIRKDKV